MLDEQNQLWSVYFVCQWNLSVNKVVKKKWLSWGICYFISNVTRLQSVSYECKKTKGVLLSPYGWVGKQCWHPNLWIRWLKNIVKSSCEPAALPATTFPVTINQKHKISLDFLKKSLKVKEVTLMCWLFVLHNEIALNCYLYLTYAPYSCFLHLPVFVSDLNYMLCETCSRLM